MIGAPVKARLYPGLSIIKSAVRSPDIVEPLDYLIFKDGLYRGLSGD